MKYPRFFNWLVVVCILIPFQSVLCKPVKQVLASEKPDVLYVVVGAFAIQKNAEKFRIKASENLSTQAILEWNPNRNLYYVYVLETEDRETAVKEALRIRENSPFKDCWVYSGFLGEVDNLSKATARGADINPKTQATITDITIGDNTASTTPVEVVKTDSVAKQTIPETATTTSTTTTVERPVLNQVELNSGKRFFFPIFSANMMDTLQGEIDLIDPANVRKVGTYKGNRPVAITKPSLKEGNVLFVCEVFGYRKQQIDVNFENPTGDFIAVAGDGEVIIPFELVRLQKGDIAVMYNVYFFKDASIMRPESRFEVNSLLEMMKENPEYTIMIHGHTNGGANGRIISMKEGSDSFFSLTNTVEGFGSSKKLSEARAIMIRDFLVRNGVSSERMQIKAWGGKRSIHEKTSARAHENVRVEIEILED